MVQVATADFGQAKLAISPFSGRLAAIEPNRPTAKNAALEGAFISLWSERHCDREPLLAGGMTYGV